MNYDQAYSSLNSPNKESTMNWQQINKVIGQEFYGIDDASSDSFLVIHLPNGETIGIMLVAEYRAELSFDDHALSDCCDEVYTFAGRLTV